MEFSIHNLQKYKLAIHIAQLAIAVVIWVLDIIVMRSTAIIDGRLGWNFGFTFLVLPAVIYLTMTVRFPRTRKFANPYALLVIDLVWCIMALSAFAAVANWNSTGKCGSACKVSKAVVGLGVFSWLFWILSTVMSVYGLMYYRREGYLPGASRAPNNAAMIDPDKEAFSTAPHDDEYAPVHHAEEHEEHELHDDGYPGGNFVGRVHSPDYEPSSYGGSYAATSTAHHDDLEASTAYTGYSASGYGGSQNSRTGRAQFPTGNYDNIPVIGQP
ncbi:hypothetical protein SBOR_5930 [Sclerotinia borealis F-4128]|uniref:MARVEL domain-containing protein n=1 Tax=Sclerotinia borealis (strain F-4128) TaxID=1432307 RepID=W9CGL4_SCLBF|nr:hypothetical protein SBOR_5930 [Sclerotinia borealis F-4128]